jgi:hypothetical protein
MWCFFRCFGEEIASLSLDNASSLYDSDQEDRPVRVASEKRVRRYYDLQERGRIPVPLSIRQTKFPAGYVKPQKMTASSRDTASPFATNPFGVVGPSRIARVGKKQKMGDKGQYEKVQSDDEHDFDLESRFEIKSDDELDDEGKWNLDQSCGGWWLMWD